VGWSTYLPFGKSKLKGGLVLKLSLKSAGLAAVFLLSVPTISYADSDPEPQDISAETNAELEAKSKIKGEVKVEEKIDIKEIKTELKEIKENAPEKFSDISESSGVSASNLSSKNIAKLGASTLASSSALGTNGDILITYDTDSVLGWNYGHAAIVRWDAAYVVEAMPDDGVRYHVNNWKSRYNSWKGLWVKGATDGHYTDAQAYARGQLGKKYSLVYGKYQSTYFYCSLLAWKSWKISGSSFDLDDDGGVVVTPGDIDQDSQTITYASK